jgi:hypothetical protein
VKENISWNGFDEKENTYHLKWLAILHAQTLLNGGEIHYIIVNYLVDAGGMIMLTNNLFLKFDGQIDHLNSCNILFI